MREVFHPLLVGPTRGRHPATPLVLLAIAALSILACGREEKPEGKAEVSSVPRLEPVAAFGCGECEGPEQLARPGVSVGPSGRVYVAAFHEPHVRVLEPDGSVAFTTGATGEGPGEIRQPFILGVLEEPDGSFWVQEAAFVHHFDAEGASIESVTWPTRLPLGYGFDHERGLIYLVAAPVPTPGGQDAPRRSLVRFSPGEPRLETVAPWEKIVEVPLEEGVEQDARFTTLAVGPDGRLALADILYYRVRVLSPDGALLAEFGRPDLPRPLKSEEQVERERELARRRGSDEPDPEGPSLGPWATYDGGGRLWLTVRRDPSLLDVFGPDGTFLGEISLPGELAMGFRAIAAHGDRLATVLIDDETGQPAVHVWRIVGS